MIIELTCSYLFFVILSWVAFLHLAGWCCCSCMNKEPYTPRYGRRKSNGAVHYNMYCTSSSFNALNCRKSAAPVTPG